MASHRSASQVGRLIPGSLEWRCIGPYRGGRVVTVAGDVSNPMVFYFGCAGGVWKTNDGGTYWENVSDGFFKTSAVGAIAVSESDSNVIYAGMGESCTAVPRLHWTSRADGMYRSTDAGRSWVNIGLEKTRYIARLRIHPDDPDLVYASVLGHLEGPDSEKGVFRSDDGGRSWERVLFCSENAGSNDIWMDPRLTHGSYTRRRGTRVAATGTRTVAARTAAYTGASTGATPGPT